MNLLLLSEEAAVYRSALIGGAATPAEIVAWADGWIWRLDEPPDALIQASLNGSRRNELLTDLGELAEAKLSLGAAAMLCRLLLEHVSTPPTNFRLVTRLLAQMNAERALPDELSDEASRLDDSLSLAETGVFSLPEVQQEILTFLRQHAG